MTTKLLSLPNCVACRQTGKRLDNAGVTYEKIDMSQDESAHALAKSLGYMAAPVVAVFNEVGELVNSWSGYKPELIDSLVTA